MKWQVHCGTGVVRPALRESTRCSAASRIAALGREFGSLGIGPSSVPCCDFETDCLLCKIASKVCVFLWIACLSGANSCLDFSNIWQEANTSFLRLSAPGACGFRDKSRARVIVAMYTYYITIQSRLGCNPTRTPTLSNERCRSRTASAERIHISRESAYFRFRIPSRWNSRCSQQIQPWILKCSMTRCQAIYGRCRQMPWLCWILL